MSLKKIQQVKKDRGFKIADLIVYGAILLLVAATFLAVFIPRDNSPLAGVRACVGSKVLFEYDFEKGEYSSFSADVTVSGGEVLSVRIEVNGGYNVLEINKSKRTAKIVEADCRGKDCVHTPAISDNSGIIYCSPHGLKIVPFGLKEDNTVII